MFGIFFLIIVPLCILIYISAIKKAVKNSTPKVKKSIYIIFFVLPAIYPFIHLVSPNYFYFLSACEKSKNYTLVKPMVSEIYPAPRFIEGYRALLEKPYVAFIFDSKKYTPTAQYRSKKCISACETYRFNTIELCIDGKCVNEADYRALPLGIKSVFSSSESRGVFNSLLYTSKRQLVHHEHGVLAEKQNHRFYPYGDGWASILGAASGTAPSYTCKVRPKFNYYEITPPK